MTKPKIKFEADSPPGKYFDTNEAAGEKPKIKSRESNIKRNPFVDAASTPLADDSRKRSRSLECHLYNAIPYMDKFYEPEPGRHQSIPGRKVSYLKMR